MLLHHAHFYPTKSKSLRYYSSKSELVQMRSTKGKGHWSDKHHQKEFFDKLAIKLNIKKLDDWNNVTKSMVVKEGGHFINSYYNSSLTKGIYLLLSITRICQRLYWSFHGLR
jgi:hypothetical protein